MSFILTHRKNTILTKTSLYLKNLKPQILSKHRYETGSQHITPQIPHFKFVTLHLANLKSAQNNLGITLSQLNSRYNSPSNNSALKQTQQTNDDSNSNNRKLIVQEINELIEKMYENQHENDNQKRIVKDEKNFKSQQQQQYTQEERSLIGLAIENRLLALSNSKKGISREVEMVMLDLITFAVHYRSLNQNILDIFLNDITKNISKKKINNDKNLQDDSSSIEQSQELANKYIKLLSCCYSNIAQNITNSDKDLIHCLFLDILHKILVDLIENQNNNLSNNTNILSVDFQIVLLKQLLTSSSDLNSPEQLAKKAFIDQFQSNPFYELWLERSRKQNQTSQGSTTDSSLSKQFLQQFKSTTHNLSLLDRKNILEYHSIKYLRENIFDHVLLKGQLKKFSSLMDLLEVFPVDTLDEIPAENYIQLCQKLSDKPIQVIEFMEKLADLDIFQFQLSQRLQLFSVLSDSVLQSQTQEPELSEIDQTNNLQVQKSPFDIHQSIRMLNIFSKVCVCDNQMINLCEQILNENNSWQKLSIPLFIKALTFFGKYPGEMNSAITRSQINFYVTSKFQKMNISQRLSVVLNLLKLEQPKEGVPSKKISRLKQLTEPVFCTAENISIISDFLIQLNSARSKSMLEKVQFFFILRTFFRDEVLISDSQMNQMNELIQAFKLAGITTVSQLQKAVIQDLMDQDLLEQKDLIPQKQQQTNPIDPAKSMNKSSIEQIKQEVFIDDVFSIDYLINEKIILEVNGPSHYFYISNLDSHTHNKQQHDIIATVYDASHSKQFALLENRNTSIKTALLESLGYKVKSIPLYLYNHYKQTNKHKQFVFEAVFSNASLQDLMKIL